MAISDKVRKRRQNHHERRVAASKFILEKKLIGCHICGENRPECLDFHHIDPSTKKYGVAQMVGMKLSLKTIQEEIDKCQVTCANCHRVITAQERKFYNRNNFKLNPNIPVNKIQLLLNI